jgi:pullulanase/glycogen debranching enzyme
MNLDNPPADVSGLGIPGNVIADYESFSHLILPNAQLRYPVRQIAEAKALAVRLSGEPGLMHLTERGEQEPDDTFLILLNASHDNVTFRIPVDPTDASWEIVVDTAAEADAETPQTHAAGGETSVDANSLRLLVLLKQVNG